jgi:hypothetical protein
MNVKLLFVSGKDQKAFDSNFEKAVNNIHLQGGQIAQIIPSVTDSGLHCVIVYQTKNLSIGTDGN